MPHAQGSPPGSTATEVGLAGGEVLRLDLPINDVLRMLDPGADGLDPGLVMDASIDWPGEYHFNPAHVTFVREAKPAKSRRMHAL